MFDTPVRLGTPQIVAGLTDVAHNPIHATGVGLLIFGQKNLPQYSGVPDSAGFTAIWERMKSWFQGNF